MNRSEIAAQYREDWAHNRQTYTMQQVLDWEIKNDFKLLPWQRDFLLHSLNGGIVTIGRQWGKSTIRRAAEGIRADTLILDEVHVMSVEELRKAYEKPVKGFIPFSMETEPDPNEMVNRLREEITDASERQFHHDIWHDMIYGPEKVKARYGTLQQEWEGYPVTQDNKGLFQTQPGNFGKLPLGHEADRAVLERRITNQRKELKRLNACLKMQAAQAIQQGKRFELRKRAFTHLEDRNVDLERQLEHERALSAYWHNEFKALKKNKKGKK